MQIPNSVFSLVILRFLHFLWGRYDVPTASRPAPLWDTPAFLEALSETQSDNKP